METTGRIEKDNIVAMLFGVLNARLCNVHRVCAAHLKNGYVKLSADCFKLLNSSGAVNVAGYEQRALAAFFHQSRKLCTVGGFTCTLQADKHDHARRLRGDVELYIFAAHEGAKLLVYNFYNHLRGCKAVQHVLPHGALADVFDKVLDDLVADVRFKKRKTHLSHGFLDVRLSQSSLAAKLFEGGG